ncbi:hypothetical protein N0V90_008677 [Kalmusia sp. IMI 367209]|nr:hypothetical protein N0V90_008677 [Kalmusia sp. IMI 367209]
MEELCRPAYATLQGLPAEMRLKIYEHMTPPVDSRIADWRGIFLSCKQFNHEMKHELLRNMVRYLEQLKTEWTRIHGTQLHISIPTTIAAIEKLTVSIPNSYFRAREARFPAARFFSVTLMSLVQLGISQLTFGRYEDDQTMKRTTVPITEHSLADFMRDLLDFMEASKPARVVTLDDGTEHVLSQGTAIDRIVFEWGVFEGAFADEDLILPYYAEDHPSDRTVQLKREHICGPATGAVWTRRQYTWYGQVYEDFWDEIPSLSPR